MTTTFSDEPTTVRVGAPGGAGGWGSREDVRGYTVLDLHGTDAAIGALYGRLLRRELLGRYVPMLERQHYGALPRVFRWLFERAQRRYPDFFDAAAEARAEALERALGLAPGTMRRYAWFTELSAIGPALQLATAGTVQCDGVTGATAAGCTSVVSRDGDATLHARNLDYWGMGYWQPLATLLFVEPLDARGRADGHRYAHLGTVGELFAGSSGVNARGLAVTSHLHVTRDVALVEGRLRMSRAALVAAALARGARAGESIYALFERLLRRAATVGEACDLLRAARPVGAWSFVLSDPSGDRAVVGVNHRDVAVARDAAVATNFYTDPAMHARELRPARGPIEGSRRRYARARDLLAAHPDGMTVADAVAILRDRFDAATGTERAVSPNTIVSPDTSHSVVFRTRADGDHALWLAVPHADGYTPAPLAPFFGLRFRDGFAPGRAVLGEVASAPRPDLDGVLAAYLDAMRLLLDEHAPDRALQALRAIQTDDPAVALMAAWLAASQGAYRAARADLDRALAAPAPMTAHHRILAAFLAGELARARQAPSEAAAWYERALARIAEDRGEHRDLNAMLAFVLRDRIARAGRGGGAFPVPDLKFQDVLELRVGR